MFEQRVCIRDWLYDEFKQTGKDYSSPEEVAAYDSSHSKFRDLKKESNEILDALSVEPGQALVDVGCGTGELSIEAAKRKLNVFAVDISDAMRIYAEKKASHEGVENIRFLKGGFFNLPEEIEDPDIIVSSFSLHHLPDFWKLEALKNCASLLKKEGKLFIQDVVIDEEDCVSTINDFIVDQTEKGGDFLKTDAIEHFRDEYSTYTWIFEEMLRRANLKIMSTCSTRSLIKRYVCHAA